MSQIPTRIASFSTLALAISCLCGPVLATGTASAQAEVDPVVSRGLAYSSERRNVAVAAVARANAILDGSGRGLRLFPDGRPVSKVGKEKQGTPVYLVRVDDEADSTPAAVPRACDCIFVDMRALHRWVTAHSTGSGRLELDAANLLAFMLLHEVGHIASHNAGVEFSDGAMSQLNIDPSIAKANEEKADRFAVSLVRSRMQQVPASAVSLSATSVAMELTKLSWNMQAYRTLDEFGAWASGKPAVFFDPNYSHPNLAWRILSANHMIHGSSDTKALLDAFEEARQRGANPAPLYTAPRRDAKP
jgi:hypothetical protein